MILKRLWGKVRQFPLSVWAFLIKEYMLLIRKKKYLYLSLALPLFLGIIYVFMLLNSSGSISVMVCDFDDTDLTRNVLSEHTEFVVDRATDEECLERMATAIHSRSHLFGIVIEDGFTYSLKDLQQAELLVFYDNSDPSIASLAEWKIDVALQPFKNSLVISLSDELKQKSMQARTSTKLAVELSEHLEGRTFSAIKRAIVNADNDLKRIENIDPGFVAIPVMTQKHGVHKEHNLMDLGIVSLFAVLNLFLLLMLCSTGVLYDRKTGLFKRIRASNSSMFSYVLAKLIYFLSVSIAEFVIILLLFIAFGARYTIVWSTLIWALLFISFVNTLIGILIGLVSDSEGVAVLMSLIITLPLLFLSGMFFPLEIMPKILQWFAKVMPLYTEVFMLKQAVLLEGIFSLHYFWIPVVLCIICLYFMNKRN